MGLFGKKVVEPEIEVAERPAPPKPAQKETFMAKREDDLTRGGDVNAVLGRGTEFEGKLTFEGEVRIAGKFTGEIFSKDRLQIDDGARVHAEITSGAVIVYGEVTGNIKALQFVELRSTARVRGNIETPSLMIEKGVMFEGSCKMENVGKQAAVMPLAASDKK